MTSKNASLQQQAARKIDSLQPELLDLSHRIHGYKEIGFNEFQSVAAIVELLDAQGYTYTRPAGGLETAITATVGTADHPHVAILAEYDALAEIGHGCGHNVIATCAVGAFLGAASVISQCGGRLSLVGTPAEEGGAGKVIMIENGVFDDIDYALMIHPTAGESLIFRGGRAATSVRVNFNGKSAHSSVPKYGLNALSAARNLFSNIDLMRPTLSMQDNINGVILESGQSANVIPDKAVCNFSLRSETAEELGELVNLVIRAAECSAKLTGCQCRFEVRKIYAERYPNKPMCEQFKENMGELGVPMSYPDPKKQYGSSDVGNVSIKMPAIHDYLAIADEGINAHSLEFADAAISARADEVCILGAKGLAMTAIDILTDEPLRQNIQSFFKEQVPHGYAEKIETLQAKLSQLNGTTYPAP